MRLFIIFTVFFLHACSPYQQESDGDSKKVASLEQPLTVSVEVSFIKDIKPILMANCQPCHFEGGKMYKQLPFDTCATILRLREKLFTRIKDAQQQDLIKAYLKANPQKD